MDPSTPPRRRYAADFKAKVVAACQQPKANIPAVASTYGIHPAMLRRWVRSASTEPAFVPVKCSEPFTAEPIRLAIRCGKTTMDICWPADQADHCMTLLRDLLR
jgi:transposase-like protein